MFMVTKNNIFFFRFLLIVLFFFLEDEEDVPIELDSNSSLSVETDDELLEI